MSILTKISIVLLVVLVPVACVVFIQLASRLPVCLDGLDRQGKELESVKQGNRHLQLALQRAQDQGKRYAAGRQAAVADKRTVQEALQAQINGLVVDKLSMAANLAGLTAANQAHGEGLKMEIARGDRLEAQLTKFRERTNKLKVQVNELDTALVDRKVAIARLERTVQKFREDIADGEKEIAHLLARLAAHGRPVDAATGEAATGVGPDVPLIQGTITAIEDDVASINIGAAKGIKKGMKLIVFRDDNFVAYLQIELVDLNSAAGVIVSKRLEPRPNDKVKTKTR